MAFQIDKFTTAKWQDRITIVPVPELKEFFDEGDELTWTLKCISASEVATARDHVKNSRNKEDLINSLFKHNIPDNLLNELKEKAGIKRTDGKVHKEVIFRKAILMAASVNPTCSETMALILGERFPETFDRLANEAFELIGLGASVGE